MKWESSSDVNELMTFVDGRSKSLEYLKFLFISRKKKLLLVKHSVSQIVRKGMLAKQICVVGRNIYLEGSQINCFARLSCFSFCYDLQKIESNFKL